MIQIGQRLKALIRYRYHADVRVDSAERIVCALRARLRDRIEQSGLADVRETDDAEFHMFSSKFSKEHGKAASKGHAPPVSFFVLD